MFMWQKNTFALKVAAVKGVKVQMMSVYFMFESELWTRRPMFTLMTRPVMQAHAKK